MKKRRAAFLAVALLGCLLLAGCGQPEVNYAEHLQDYVRTMDYHDNFTVLQLTDIHWSTGSQIGDKTYGSRAYITKVIEEAKRHAGQIDLIALTGDSLMLANDTTLDTFLSFMAELQIPYTVVWGNHDREGLYSTNTLCRRFAEAPYSLYTEVDNDNVHGRSNYVVNLTEDGSVKWQLFQLDSGAYFHGSPFQQSFNYDYIRQDQLDWLSAEHALAGADVPAICYYHIPQADAWRDFNAISEGAQGYRQKFFKLENFGSSAYAPYMHDTFSANNVKAAFMGHAHNIDWTYTTPDGITFGLGVKTDTELYSTEVPAGYTNAGFEVTEGFQLIGASLVTLNNDQGDFTLEHLYLNERDGGDFVLWVNYND